MSSLITPFGFSSSAADVAEGIDLTGRRAVVSGASSGLGAETARALAATGMAVTLAVRDGAAGERVAKGITASTGNQEVHVAHHPFHHRVARSTACTREQRGRHGLPRAVHRAGLGVAVRHQPSGPLRPRHRTARGAGR